MNFGRNLCWSLGRILWAWTFWHCSWNLRFLFDILLNFQFYSNYWGFQDFFFKAFSKWRFPLPPGCFPIIRAQFGGVGLLFSFFTNIGNIWSTLWPDKAFFICIAKKNNNPHNVQRMLILSSFCYASVPLLYEPQG